MSNPFDTGNPPTGGHWPRRSRRETIQAEVAYRKSGQLRYPVRLFDASLGGCKIEFVERPKVGDRVWVKFAGIQALSACVCWVDGFIGGVEFDQPIHPAVFERLITQLR